MNRHHNAPPLAERLGIDHEGLATAVADAVALPALPPIFGDNDLPAYTERAKYLKDMAAMVEKARKREKDQILKDGRTIDDFFKGMAAPVLKAIEEFVDAINAHQRKMLAEKRAAEEAARKAAEAEATINWSVEGVGRTRQAVRKVTDNKGSPDVILLPSTRQGGRLGRIDFLGAALLAVATTAFILGIEWQKDYGFASVQTLGLLAASVAILVFPVSLQIFSRYTELIPSYIWTEEMARFFFIWSILLGAMVGGVAEYLALLTGFRWLLILIAVCYVVAILTRREEVPQRQA